MSDRKESGKRNQNRTNGEAKQQEMSHGGLIAGL